MLSRSQRLSGTQLEEVIKEGRASHSPFFWLRFVKKEGKTGFSVLSPSKLIKKAVTRNNLRRKVYNAIRGFSQKIKENYHVAICIKEPVLKAPNEQIIEEVEKIFVKAGLLK